jgi:hypothetical protein
LNPVSNLIIAFSQNHTENLTGSFFLCMCLCRPVSPCRLGIWTVNDNDPSVQITGGKYPGKQRV